MISQACDTDGRTHSLAPTTVKKIAESTVRRLSLYLRFLEEFEKLGRDTISSGELAKHGGTTSAQVRKDLSFFGSFGTRGLGYGTKELTAQLRQILGLSRPWRVVIVGAGKIGGALAQYPGFHERGFDVVGVFDSDAARIGESFEGVRISDVARLESEVARLGAEIAVLAVPPSAARAIADRLTRAGIKAILDFSTAPLALPRGVAVRSVDLALELEVLSYALTNA